MHCDGRYRWQRYALDVVFAQGYCAELALKYLMKET